jgi:predicted short-subunit dehydrogenase-like oxidoreductase (DUF2520 family)
MLQSIALVGPGRVGSALAASLSRAGVEVIGPFGRHDAIPATPVVLLCVPDREIPSASARVAVGSLVGHVSASAPLSLLEPHERFNFHPLLSITGADASFTGATCAIDASSERGLAVAEEIAARLGMRARTVPPEKRALYHAAASTAANFVTTILGATERMADVAGVPREAFRPLVQSALDRWVEKGARTSLTGPIARGDEITVTRQRAAVEELTPELLELWDSLVKATRRLAKGER